MKHLLLPLSLPLSLAGAIAVILKAYSETSSAQRSTAVLIDALTQLAKTIPQMLLYLGLLMVLLSIAYMVFAFANAASHRVKATTKGMIRLAGKDSIVREKLLNNGYRVIDNPIPIHKKDI